MLIKLTGGKVYDPAHEINGVVMDIYVRDGRIVARPNDSERIDQEYNLHGKVVMAGAIDMHTHIGGGKVNIARMMLPEDHRGDQWRTPSCVALVAATLHLLRSPPAIATPKWATPRALSLRCCPSTRVRRIWRWAMYPS